MPDKQPGDLLEPGAVEVARPVLRGEWPSDGLLLPDYANGASAKFCVTMRQIADED